MYTQDPEIIQPQDFQQHFHITALRLMPRYVLIVLKSHLRSTILTPKIYMATGKA